MDLSKRVLLGQLGCGKGSGREGMRGSFCSGWGAAGEGWDIHQPPGWGRGTGRPVQPHVWGCLGG